MRRSDGRETGEVRGIPEVRELRLDELLQGKEALITDLDGTLVDLGINWDSLRERVRAEMGWDHPLKPLGPSIPKAARNKDEEIRAFKIVEEEEIVASSRADRNPKLIKIFEKIKGMGLKLALVTLQARKPALIALERLGILGFFDAVITRESSLDRKEQLIMALDELGVDPSKCIFFGDTPWDVDAGRELGIKTVCVGRRIDGCDYFIQKFEDLAVH